jgi:MFS family permease
VHRAIAAIVVFLSGFAIMVLEIVGARYLAKDFGSSFYVWVSQIGLVLTALAIGYTAGGALADRFPRASFLVLPLAMAAALTFTIPSFTPPLIDGIINRHPPDQPIAPLWQKLDPVLGSALLFFIPCFILAMLPPWMIRLSARELGTIGTTSGVIYAAGTVGSIAGVFISGYLLIEYLRVPDIFRATGLVILILALPCWALDRLQPAARRTSKILNGPAP